MNDSVSQMQKIRRPPVFWLLFVLPLSAVVAGLWTWRIASYSIDDRLPDKVYRVGQIQSTDLRAEQAAHTLGVSASLQYTQQTIWLELTYKHQTDPSPQTILLSLHHLSNGHQDQTHTLRQISETRYQSEPVFLDVEQTPVWNISIQPPSGQWRLQGRWNLQESGRATPSL